jgi:hypothetical protein
MFIKYGGTNVHSLPYVTQKAVTLRNKKTGKTRTEMRVDSRQSPQEVHWLRPGWNEFPSHIWEQNKAAPSIQAMLKDGTIELMKERTKVKDPKTGKLVEKIIGADDREISLSFFDDKKAIDIVKNTYNRDILQRWIDEETRHKVKRVLTKQIEPLLNNTIKEDDDED